MLSPAKLVLHVAQHVVGLSTACFYHDPFPWKGFGQYAAICQQVEAMPKIWRGFVDNTEARLAPGSLLLYKKVVEIKTVHLYMIFVYIKACNHEEGVGTFPF